MPTMSTYASPGYALRASMPSGDGPRLTFQSQRSAGAVDSAASCTWRQHAANCDGLLADQAYQLPLNSQPRRTIVRAEMPAVAMFLPNVRHCASYEPLAQAAIVAPALSGIGGRPRTRVCGEDFQRS